MKLKRGKIKRQDHESRSFNFLFLFTLSYKLGVCHVSGTRLRRCIFCLLPLVLSEMWKLETGLTLNGYNVSYEAHQSGVLSLSMSICCFGFCCRVVYWTIQPVLHLEENIVRVLVCRLYINDYRSLHQNKNLFLGAIMIKL